MENKFSNDSPEQVVIIPRPRTIIINGAHSKRAYGLFDTKTGTQVSEFVKGTAEKVEFRDLNPNIHYDVGAIEDMGNEKPEFTIIWTAPMRDDTDTILNNTDNLPVEYPRRYLIKDNGNNKGVFDLVDDNDNTVGQVIKVAPTGDKPRFCQADTFRMKDDTQK